MNDIASFRPELLRLANPGERVRFQQLRAAHDPPSLFDVIEAQLADLARIRSVTRRLSAQEAADAGAKLLGGCPREEYGVWAFYPWSNRLVHLLDEVEFVELRTNRNKHKITVDEQADLSRKRVGVVGLSVGQAVAVTMAMERGFGEIRLADFDSIDLSNLNRIRTGIHNLGVSKVLVAAREIAELDPYLCVRCFPEGLTVANFEEFFEDGGRLDLLIEECDSIDIKIEVRYEARKRGIPVLMDTSDRGLLDIERFDLHPGLPIFHGLIGEPQSSRLRGLTTEEKVPYVLGIIGPAMSPRMAASLIEVESTISTWPQLGSSVALGGALAADVARRMLLGYCHVNGRFLVDLEAIVPNVAQPAPPPHAALPQPLREDRMAQWAAAAERVWPETGTQPSADEIRSIVEAGIAAPSGGNCQPWHFFATGLGLHLFHEVARSASLLDFESGGAYAALGAAWENCVLRAHECGWELQSYPFPNGRETPLVVSMRFQKTPASGTEPHDWDTLAPSIGVRRTDRRLARDPIGAELLDRLNAVAASIPGCRIDWFTEPSALESIAELVGAGDRIRFLHPELHRHMFSELRFSEAEANSSGDGISLDSLRLSAADRAVLEVLRRPENLEYVRNWKGGRNLMKMSRKSILAAAAVGMLTVPLAMPDNDLPFLLAGRAVERVWLEATRLGLRIQPMTALPYLMARLVRGGGQGLDDFAIRELEGLRLAYQALFGERVDRADVLLFRVHGAPGVEPAASRRPLDLAFTDVSRMA